MSLAHPPWPPRPGPGWPYPPPARARLLDGRGTASVRETIGSLLTHAREAAFAVGRIRLAALDFTADHFARLERCRVLLGGLDADSVATGPRGSAAMERREDLRALLEFARGGRLEIRSAGLVAWEPDFSLYEGLGGRASLLLVGNHHFVPCARAAGPTLTVVLDQEEAVERARESYQALWMASYDVRGVVEETLEGLLEPLPPPRRMGLPREGPAA